MIHTSQGWRGLFAVESSEVLFLDRIVVRLDKTGQARADIDPIWIETCEPGSLYVLSACGALGGVGAAICCGGNRIHCQNGEPEDTVTVTVAGLRRGMTLRLQEYPADVAMKNNDFWNTAWK